MRTRNAIIVAVIAVILAILSVRFNWYGVFGYNGQSYQ